jgi:eukaryotic-like serine/threonine-protein kinase
MKFVDPITGSEELPLSEQEQIDCICLEFENRLRRGERPPIETYLRNVPADSTAPLLRELLALDYHYLVARGEQPNRDEYKSRFANHAEIVDEVFRDTPGRARPTDSCDDRAATSLAVCCPQCGAFQDVSSQYSARDALCPACGCEFTVVLDEAQTKPSAPRQVGRFKLVKMIGSGQFGVVWLARDEALDRVVALKLPRKGQLSADELQQFQREARAAAQLQHPNIVRIHEVGVDSDVLYIVSEYIDGLTLADWIASDRPTVQSAVELCRTLAEALHHAHEAGVVHRDLKPSNILLARAKESAVGAFPFVPYIADFGLGSARK